ncbi:unnamed protein product [Musa textilis]
MRERGGRDGISRRRRFHARGLTEESEHTAGENGMRRCCFRCVLTSLPVSLLMFLFLAMPGDAIPFPFRAYPSPISSRELQLDPCFALLSVLSYLPVRPSDFSGQSESDA